MSHKKIIYQRPFERRLRCDCNCRKVGGKKCVCYCLVFVVVISSDDLNGSTIFDLGSLGNDQNRIAGRGRGNGNNRVGDLMGARANEIGHNDRRNNSADFDATSHVAINVTPSSANLEVAEPHVFDERFNLKYSVIKISSRTTRTNSSQEPNSTHGRGRYLGGERYLENTNDSFTISAPGGRQQRNLSEPLSEDNEPYSHTVAEWELESTVDENVAQRDMHVSVTNEETLVGF
ncbi:hypothetical protein BKA67DRAFT_660315 [Truncatella angustata]|uniref:Uncharacterized protein n=1 Tax=Truncatella angustata TaxID=152316 RepID=A0A9P8ZUT8_9PEZI|nr:uncharacterized protein BKA67DRAFT_660315 [Truncatella angustata]KAH6651510.1 hypothetical protein BKA67DRAFT_660315 [Truncatella angustata]